MSPTVAATHSGRFAVSPNYKLEERRIYSGKAQCVVLTIASRQVVTPLATISQSPADEKVLEIVVNEASVPDVKIYASGR